MCESGDIFNLSGMPPFLPGDGDTCKPAQNRKRNPVIRKSCKKLALSLKIFVSEVPCH